ncbi:MAG: hypothetical protein SNJ64_06840, partial [Endomicrobiia bacterium]
MDRRKKYYKSDEDYGYQVYNDPGIIDFGNIIMYNPQDTANLAQVGQMMQERWDKAKGAISKYWEDLGAANLGSYGESVRKELDKRFNLLEGTIEKDYGGDYGRAANEIIENLSKDRALMHQASIAANSEREARNKYEQLRVAGKAPQKMSITKEGIPIMEQYTFEKWNEEKVGNNYAGGIDENTGRFILPRFAELRGASDVTSYIRDNISKAINEETNYSKLKEDNNILGMLIYDIWSGKTDTQIKNEFLNNPTNLKALANQLRNEVDFFGEETEGVSDQKVVEYVLPIIQNQVYRKVIPHYLANPNKDGVKNRKTPDITQNPIFTDEGVINEANEKAIKELEKIDSKIKEVEEIRRVQDIIQNNNLPSYEELDIPWINPASSKYKEENELWDRGEASVYDALKLGKQKIEEAIDWVKGKVVKGLMDLKNSNEFYDKIRMDLIETFGLQGLIRSTDVELPKDHKDFEIKDPEKASKYLELLSDKEKKEYNVFFDEETGLYKIKDETKPGLGITNTVDITTNRNQMITIIARKLLRGLEKQNKIIEEHLKEINKYNEENPIIHILAQNYASKFNDDILLMYQHALKDFIGLKKKQILHFNQKISLSVPNDVGNNQELNNTLFQNLKTRIFQTFNNNNLYYNRDGKEVELTKQTQEQLDKDLKDGNIISAQLDLNNFNIKITTNQSANYEIGIERLVPDSAKPTIYTIKEFIKKGTELEFFKKNHKGELIKDGNGLPIYAEPEIKLGEYIFKYELNHDTKKGT